MTFMVTTSGDHETAVDDHDKWDREDVSDSDSPDTSHAEVTQSLLNIHLPTPDSLPHREPTTHSSQFHQVGHALTKLRRYDQKKTDLSGYETIDRCIF